MKVKLFTNTDDFALRKVFAKIVFEAFAATEKYCTEPEAEETVDSFFSIPGVNIVSATHNDQVVGWGAGFHLSEQTIEKYAGFSALGVKVGEYYLAFAAVLPSFQRKGIYTRLVSARVGLASGADAVWARTWRGNAPIIKALKKLGFDEVHEEPEPGRILLRLDQLTEAT